ncbi:MAG: hypothetical protein OXH69_05205 [Acidobacteria bacterium]|nr:hypothetical protein [Acidobacteriota bacterium]
MGDRMILLQLLRSLRNDRVRDPNVDLFIAVLENKVEDVKKALADGADPNTTDKEVIGRHRDLLARTCPAALGAWTREEPEGGGTVM